MIPQPILDQGMKVIVSYMLDLFRSPQADPLYRTKVMVVGFEKVGKTTIIDCLFPLEQQIKYSRNKLALLGFNEYHLRLQGKYLWAYNVGDKKPSKQVAIFRNREYNIHTEGKSIIKLEPVQIDEGDNSQFVYFPSAEEASNWIDLLLAQERERKERPWKGQAAGFDKILLEREVRVPIKLLKLECPDQQTRDAWLTRLRRICMNEATHGIEIQSVIVDNTTTREFFVDERKNSKLEVTVWDFAGQGSYYHSHHYFLSSRTVFLVLYDLEEKDKGLQGLEFWFKSLASHLGSEVSEEEAATAEKNFSILVVGTHLDKVHSNLILDREDDVREIARAVGIACHIDYQEVSCNTLQNIEPLRNLIATRALAHSYMGERVPRSYLQVLELIRSLRGRKVAPIISIEELNKDINNLDLLRRALRLLALWGECVYFENTAELANVVVLDPRFLTKAILAQFFKPNHTNMFKDGLITHQNIQMICKTIQGFESIELSPESFYAILERFEVCFPLEEDKGRPFLERRSLVPALLTAKRGGKEIDAERDKIFRDNWPSDPPFNRKVEIERAVLFNVIPDELVSRVLVRLRPLVQSGLLWRDEVVILDDKTQTQAWVRISIAENSLCVSLRGPSKQSCVDLMKYLVSVVELCSQTYIGVKWSEAVRSPHSATALISKAALDIEAARSLADRKLKCPETKLPLKAEVLLAMGGYVDSPGPVQTPWWDSAFARGEQGPLGVSVLDHGTPLSSSALATQLLSILPSVGVNPGEVSVAYAVDNPMLRLSLQNSLQMLQQKMIDTKSLFKKQDWKLDTNHLPDLKKVLHHMASHVSRFRSANWNDGQLPAVVPMIQRLPEKIAWIIAKYGFSALPSSEQSSYTRGVYFTNSLDYARLVTPGEPEETYVYLVSLIAPGNVYPVIDTPSRWVAKRPCRPGYQSHYILVQTNLEMLGKPAKGNATLDELAGELVISDPSQAMPLFILKMDTDPPAPEMPLGERREEVRRPEWSVRLDESWNSTLPPLVFSSQHRLHLSLFTT